MKIAKKSIFLIIFAIFTSAIFSESEKNTSKNIIPVLGSSPETGILFGGFFIYNKTGSELDPQLEINTSAGGFYTLKHQLMILGSYTRNFDNDKNRLDCSFNVSSWPSKFFGIGMDSQENNEEKYDKLDLSLDLKYEKEVLNNFYLGFISKTSYVKISEINPNGIIYNENLLINSHNTNIGFGFSLLYDKRDHKVFSTSGQMISIETEFYDKNICDNSYIHYGIDYRLFYSPVKKHILGLNILSELNNGNIAFYQLQSLGERNIMRGIEEQRYVDKSRIVGQIEYRFPIYKKISGVSFVSSGQVAPRLDEINFSDFEYTYGTGLRYLLIPDNKTNLRLDFGFSKSDFGVYVEFSEAF